MLNYLIFLKFGNHDTWNTSGTQGQRFEICIKPLKGHFYRKISFTQLPKLTFYHSAYYTKLGGIEKDITTSGGQEKLIIGIWGSTFLRFRKELAPVPKTYSTINDLCSYHDWSSDCTLSEWMLWDYYLPVPDYSRSHWSSKIQGLFLWEKT